MRPTQDPIGRRFQNETKYIRPLPREYARLGQKPGSGKTISLALPPVERDPGIWETLGRRRSIREYGGEPISAAELSRLLWAAQGLTGDSPSPFYRTAPSAGALHPIDTYLVVNRAEGLEPGIYFLDVSAFALEMKRAGDCSGRIAGAALEQPAVREAAVILVWVAVIHRSAEKYRERAYRYIYLDCGHICQNVYLAAAALDLGCCGIAAFFDEEVNLLVGADGEKETAVYLAAVGRKVKTVSGK